MYDVDCFHFEISQKSENLHSREHENIGDLLKFCGFQRKSGKKKSAENLVLMNLRGFHGLVWNT